MLNKFKQFDGRLIIVAYILIYLLLMLAVINISGYEKGMRHFDIPPMVPIFADLHVIVGAHETFHQGGNPYVENLNDPWKRLYNYPPILLILGDMGLTKNTIVYAGTAMAILFIITLYILFGRLSVSQGFYCALVTCSSSTVLAIERGNIDLLIFILIVISAYFFSIKDRLHNYFGGLILLLASIIKLYPVFAMITVLNLNKNNTIRIGLVYFILFALYLFLISNELSFIFENTPKGSNRSYGSAVLPANLLLYVWPELPQDRNYFIQLTLILGISVLFILCFIIFYITYKKRRSETDTIVYANSFHLYSFQSGVAIFIGTFALGSNFDYRLIFLLLTVPQLLSWYNNNSDIKKSCFISLGLILALMQWNFFSFEWTPRIIILNEISSWVLVGFLFNLLLKTFPVWLFNWNKLTRYN